MLEGKSMPSKHGGQYQSHYFVEKLKGHKTSPLMHFFSNFGCKARVALV